MNDEFLIKDAEGILKGLLETGDPFSGDDWSLVQILRDYLKLKRKDEPIPPETAVEYWCTECHDFHC